MEHLTNDHCVIPSSCVIPSVAEGPRIFHDARKIHPNHASSDVFGAGSVVEGDAAGIQKDRGPSATLGMTQKKGGARDDTKKGMTQ